MITASEKKDSATRHNITAPPNRPTFPNSSLNVIFSSCDRNRISTYVEQTDGGNVSVEQTGDDNKSTRVLIPPLSGCCYLCAKRLFRAGARKETEQPSG
jgi:hypothetical protein